MTEPPRETTTDELVGYLNLMEQIKGRLRLMDVFVGGTPRFGRADYDYEFLCLHLRKILELIAFGTLVANQELYARHHESFRRHWRAKQILDNMQAINPNFYPIPVSMGTTASGARNFKVIDEGVLTKDEFSALYDRCSFVIHSLNPLREGAAALHFGYEPATWIQRIKWLLSNHFIMFADSSDAWFIALQDPRDYKAHGYRATSVAVEDFPDAQGPNQTEDR